MSSFISEDTLKQSVIEVLGKLIDDGELANVIDSLFSKAVRSEVQNFLESDSGRDLVNFTVTNGIERIICDIIMQEVSNGYSQINTVIDTSVNNAICRGVVFVANTNSIEYIINKTVETSDILRNKISEEVQTQLNMATVSISSNITNVY